MQAVSECMGPGATGQGCDHVAATIVIFHCGSHASYCWECHKDFLLQVARSATVSGTAHCSGMFGCRGHVPHQLFLDQLSSVSLN